MISSLVLAGQEAGEFRAGGPGRLRGPAVRAARRAGHPDRARGPGGRPGGGLRAMHAVYRRASWGSVAWDRGRRGPEGWAGGPRSHIRRGGSRHGRWPDRAGLADQALRGGRRRRRHRPDDRQRRVLLAARPVGLREDHHAAADRRLRAADRRAGSCSTTWTCPASRRTSATSTRSSRATRCSRS